MLDFMQKSGMTGDRLIQLWVRAMGHKGRIMRSVILCCAMIAVCQAAAPVTIEISVSPPVANWELLVRDEVNKLAGTPDFPTNDDLEKTLRQLSDRLGPVIRESSDKDFARLTEVQRQEKLNDISRETHAPLISLVGEETNFRVEVVDVYQSEDGRTSRFVIVGKPAFQPQIHLGPQQRAAISEVRRVFREKRRLIPPD